MNPGAMPMPVGMAGPQRLLPMRPQVPQIMQPRTAALGNLGPSMDRARMLAAGLRR